MKLSGSEALTSEASEMDTLNSEKTGETGEAAKADPGVKYSVFSMQTSRSASVISDGEVDGGVASDDMAAVEATND